MNGVRNFLSNFLSTPSNATIGAEEENDSGSRGVGDNELQASSVTDGAQVCDVETEARYSAVGRVADMGEPGPGDSYGTQSESTGRAGHSGATPDLQERTERTEGGELKRSRLQDTGKKQTDMQPMKVDQVLQEAAAAGTEPPKVQAEGAGECIVDVQSEGQQSWPKLSVCVAETCKILQEEEVKAELLAKEVAAKAKEEASKAAEADGSYDDFGFGKIDLGTDDCSKKLDLDVLAGLVRASWQVLEHVRGRDVVMLLGNTGVGKSTLIHAVAGRNLRKRTRSAHDSDCKVVWDVDDPVEGFSVGHDKESKTKCFRQYTPVSSSVVYLDAPGYEDTAGAEVDIATSVVFRKVAEVCKRLRFVALIDCNMFFVDRGGPLRQFLELVRSFVPDFSQHKYAFSFIFSKTDALDHPKTAADARGKLIDQVLSLGKATPDASLRQVLMFIKRCLDEQEPFVEVFNPEFSDASHLRRTIEAFLRPGDTGPTSAAIDSPRTVIKAGLTHKAMAQLKLDLRDLSEEICNALGASRVARASKLFGTLEFLHEHIDKSFTKDVYDAALKAMGAFATKDIQKTFALMQMGMVRTGDGSLPIISDFSENEGREVLRGIARLQLLPSAKVPNMQHSPAEDAMACLDTARRDMLDVVRQSFQAAASVDADIGSEISQMQQAFRVRASALCALQMLQVWARVHPDLAREAVAAEASMQEGRQQAFTIASALATSEAPTASQLVFALVQLFQTHTNSEPRPDVVHTLDKCRLRIEEAISSIAGEAATSLGVADDGDATDFKVIGDAQLEAYHGALRSMDHVCSLLAIPKGPGYEAFAEMCSWVRAKARFALNEAKAYLHRLVSEVKHVVSSFEVPGTSAQRLEVLLATTDRLAGLLTTEQHLECGTEGLYATAVSHAKGAVDTLCSQSEGLVRALKEGRSVEPTEHAAKLNALSRCAWYDEHRLKCHWERCVEPTLSQLREEYISISQQKHSDAHLTLQRCMGDGGDSSGADAQRFQEASSVMEQLSHLSAEILGVQAHVSGFEADAQALVDQWYEKVTALKLESLTYIASPERDALAAEMEDALRVCEVLKPVQLLSARAEDVGQRLDAHLSSMHKKMSDLFSGSRHKRKCAVLVALGSWQELGLMRLVARLPNANQLREKIKAHVEEVDKRARAAVEEASSDLGAAEKALTELEELATAYAELECGKSAAATVRDQRQLLELRTKDLEKEMEESLEKGSFSMVRDFMEPLVGSNDKLKVAKLKRLTQAANETLKSKLEAALKHLGNASAVVAAVKFLQDAGEHIEGHLDFSASSAADDLRKKAQDHLQKLVEKLDAAMADSDYEQIFSQAPVVKEYLVTISPLSTVLVTEREKKHNILKRAKQALDSAGKCLDKVDQAVEQFASNLNKMKPGQNDFETSVLCKLLNQLRSAAGVDGLKDLSGTQLTDRYGTASRKLSSGLEGFLQQARVLAQQDKLFTVAIQMWTYVNREMARGLTSHVSVKVDFQAELEQMRREEEEATNKMRNNLTIEEIQSHVQPTLSSLKQKATGIWAFWYKSTYELNKKVFAGSVTKMIADMKQAIVTQHDFIQGGILAETLNYIQESSSLREHVEAHRLRNEFEKLSKTTVKQFRSLCGQLKEALDESDLQNFEILFRRFHDFEVGMAKTYAAVLGAEAQGVHQAMYEWVEQKLKALDTQLAACDLGEAVDTVHLLRSAGKMLVSSFALYLDVAEEDKRHNVTDPWLRKLLGLCNKHFAFEAARINGAHFAILKLDPSILQQDPNAVEAEVKAIFNTEAKIYHPDKHRKCDIYTAIQTRLNAAKKDLLDKPNRDAFKDLVFGRSAPFIHQIKKVPKDMLCAVEELLKEYDNYDKVSDKMRHLEDLEKLMKLANVEEKEAKRCVKRIGEAVKQHMSDLERKVKKLWRDRQYRQLNDLLSACDRAAEALSRYNVHSQDWSRDIQQSVEKEIADIAAKAEECVRNKTEEEAEKKMDDFALHLICLGRILDDLPRNKDFCKQKMSRLLDLCQQQSWGYLYTFKLGLLLGQGDVGDRDKDGNVISGDDRIGKSIVADFKHFKDVTIMVWNEDVIQKHVSKIAQEAKAWTIQDQKYHEHVLDTKALVTGFEKYEEVYARCFEEWVAERLELTDLAQKAINAAKEVQPESSDDWGEQLRSELPTLVAQVFCYFTISKSGDSYRRLNKSKDKFEDIEKPTRKAKATETKKKAGPMKMDNVLLRPHSAQVLTVLNMLGYGGKTDQLQRQLMQIRTGEGKSLILGACSVVLALLGFRVRCVCYSEYLSKRDHSMFEELFDAFGVSEWVAYSTISEYSEDTVKRKGDIRALTEALLLGDRMPAAAEAPVSSQADLPQIEEGDDSAADSTAVVPAKGKKRGKKRNASALQDTAEGGAVSKQKASRSATAVSASNASRKRRDARTAKEILLVDEVDIFFGRDFYGQTHNQVVQLDVPEASQLMRAVWDLHNNGGHQSYGRLLRDVKNSEEYANILRRFPNWGDVITSEVKAMCADVLYFNDPKPEYDAGLDRLGYKVMDTIDYYGAVYRYRTAFAHLDAVTRNIFRDPNAALERALRLQVPCGKFSYANINPECILGVSGTLDYLSPDELKVMEEYNIRLFASMPSVYGDTQATFDIAGEGIKVEKSLDNYFRTITDEVNKKISSGRAAIAFFETAQQLKTFRESPYFKKVRQAKVLHEGLDPKERDFVIGKAPTSGQATFASAVFGRGTDFFCNDRELTNKGGVHVLQTFLSQQKAEEVQIKGRTARQGKQGTYGMVLLQSDLETNFELGEQGFEAVAFEDRYNMLDKARFAAHARAWGEIEKDLRQATGVDELTHKYFDAVLRGSAEQDARAQFRLMYQELRPEEERAEDYHIVFLTDSSSSMRGVDSTPTSDFNAKTRNKFNNRLGCALEACDRFVRTRNQSGASDLVTLITFCEVAQTDLRRQEAQDDVIMNLISSGWRPRYGGTSFSCAFDSAATLIRRDVSDRPILIMFLTDGQDGCSSSMLESALQFLAQNEQVSLKVIGFGSDCNTSRLQEIAARFGERGAHMAAGDELELVSSFEAAAAELSHVGKRSR